MPWSEILENILVTIGMATVLIGSLIVLLSFLVRKRR